MKRKQGKASNSAGRTDAEFASSPCSLHELGPASRGLLDRAETLELLNLLLEGERAGARGLGAIGREAPAEHRSLLADIARDEARYCAMLTGHIERLGGKPSKKTGSFYDKLIGTDGLGAQVDLLDRGQGWVVRKLGEILPRIEDTDLHRDLQEMLEVHQRNIASCAEIPR